MHDELHREEELRAALLELERAHDRERHLRQQFQRMLRSLSSVAASYDRQRLLEHLTLQLRDVLGATAVYALEPQKEGSEWLRIVASTDARREGRPWRLSGVLAQTLRGKPRLVFDATELAEYHEQPFSEIAPSRSLLIVNSGDRARPALLLAVHEEPAAFGTSHLKIVAQLAPFVNRTLLSIAAQRLYQEQRIALEKVAVFEHATDALGVGLARLDRDGSLVHKSAKLEALTADFGSVERWWALASARAALPAAERCHLCDGSHRSGVVQLALETPREKRHFELHFVGPPHRIADEGEVMLVRDVSAMRRSQEALAQSEEQLRQAHKLEAVGRLAGGVAHDFNNTLGVILGSAELALRRLREAERRGETPKPEYVAKLLEQVVEASRDGAALVDQLLAFSRRQVHKPSIVDLNDVVGRTTAMLQRLITDGIGVEVSSSPDLGIVRADPTQLVQVVLNLVLNARDAVRAGGCISIRTANVDIDDVHARMHPETPPGQYVMLMVSDDGGGIHERDLPRIFDPFFTTKSGYGTGLGLASVYGVVKQSGGSIEVESQPGVGSTFRVYLPRVDKPETSTTLEAIASPPPAGATVLIVEGNEAMREVMVSSMQDYGYEVLSAARADQGFDLARRYCKTIDVLLVDMRLEGTLGTELARRVQREIGDYPVVFVSSFPPNPGTAEAEAENLLLKPFTAQELAGRVRDVLGDRRVAHAPRSSVQRD
ncbi:MAG TPA: ATP-binding protein [Polyangiaceae bacterium]|jgi:signal transduction histidine kinase/ActR/RegA family two-component response regulator|nr:ATP-binding protein [Polyangiaceae bacterium]